MKSKKVSKPLLIGISVVVVLATLLASACTSEAPAPAPAPTPTPTPTPAPTPTPTPVEATKLLFASPSPPTEARVIAYEAWAEEFEERTEGRYTIEFSYGGALGATPEYYDLAVTGVCDISICNPLMIAGRFPITEITQLPWNFTSADIGAEAFWEFYKKGYADKEYADVKPLFIWTGEGSGLFTSEKPISTLKDVKGLKIRASGETATDVVGAIGATAVYFPITEVYGVLEKGTVDGAYTNFSAVAVFKLQEVLNYRVDPELSGSGVWAGVMNPGTYDKMPDDVKAIIDDMTDSGKYSLMVGEIDAEESAKGREVFSAAGGTFTEWDPADLAKMDELCAPIWDKWIANTEEKGLPAKEAINELYNILKSLGVEKPLVGYTPGS